ncbi:hypothetical protein [Paenibacillus tianjinensis]|uniref:Uncharacterized protein n=1 Tax=Paenibacillus tianjinensis TaxID=2810347 RepID=A0ABX7LAV1_9BACL|nr:hypothetical protein [Paenibacillus tianjinensis]QSF45290.1 hypothetical protein JRJ22_01005 [Paenibacillus tianjinensis]
MNKAEHIFAYYENVYGEQWEQRYMKVFFESQALILTGKKSCLMLSKL